jgi:endogenous inhibitor of DNA gyrase (YacG/DUF329 family)
MAQKVKITAKCPKCKKKRTFTNPLAHTPYCPECFLPVFVDKIEIWKTEDKKKTKSK